MPIDLNKQNQASGLDVLAIEALGAGSRGAPSLIAIALDEHGATAVGGLVYHARPLIFDGAVRFAGNARPFGSVGSTDAIEAVLEKLPLAIKTIVICLAHDGSPPGSPAVRTDVHLRILDGKRGMEVFRRRIVASPGSIQEIGRLERDAATWRFVEDDRVYRGFLSDLLVPDEDRMVTQKGGAGDGAAPAATNGPIDSIAAETATGYCDVDMRRSFVARAVRAGLPSDEAEIMVDLELERLRVANETVLLQRLEAVLCRFTDEDARLDDKERRDALQIVCRPAPGYAQGLRHDVADGYVVRFCRERRVKIKVGLLRWAVP